MALDALGGEGASPLTARGAQVLPSSLLLLSLELSDTEFRKQAEKAGRLARRKRAPRRTLQYDHPQGSMVVLGGRAISYERGTPVQAEQAEAAKVEKILADNTSRTLSLYLALSLTYTHNSLSLNLEHQTSQAEQAEAAKMEKILADITAREHDLSIM